MSGETMTPKEYADQLEAAVVGMSEHATWFGGLTVGNVCAVAALLRSLPGPTTDARRKELAKAVKDLGMFLVAKDVPPGWSLCVKLTEEIAALLLHPPRASRKAEIAEAMRVVAREISAHPLCTRHYDVIEKILEAAIAAIPEDEAPAVNPRIVDVRLFDSDFEHKVGCRHFDQGACDPLTGAMPVAECRIETHEDATP